MLILSNPETIYSFISLSKLNNKAKADYFTMLIINNSDYDFESTINTHIDDINDEKLYKFIVNLYFNTKADCCFCKLDYLNAMNYYIKGENNNQAYKVRR